MFGKIYKPSFWIFHSKIIQQVKQFWGFISITDNPGQVNSVKLTSQASKHSFLYMGQIFYF